MGWVLLALVGLGLIVTTLRHRVGDLPLLSFIAIYLVFLFRAPYYASRYLVPLLPALCIFAAVGAGWLISRKRSQRGRNVAIVYSLVIGLAVLQPLAFAMRYDYLLTEQDTRTIAKEWIEANIPSGTKIAVDWAKHAPPLRTMADAFPVGDVQYDIMEAGGIGLPRYSLQWYRDAGVQYMVMSSFIDDIALSSPDDIEARQLFHKALDENCKMVVVRPINWTHC